MITLNQLTIEIIVTSLLIVFGFLVIALLVTKDELTAAQNALKTQKEITGKWKAVYYDFYENDYKKLLKKTGTNTCVTKKSLVDALNEMNQHADKKGHKPKLGK